MEHLRRTTVSRGPLQEAAMSRTTKARITSATLTSRRRQWTSQCLQTTVIPIPIFLQDTAVVPSLIPLICETKRIQCGGRQQMFKPIIRASWLPVTNKGPISLQVKFTSASQLLRRSTTAPRSTMCPIPDQMPLIKNSLTGDCLTV